MNAKKARRYRKMAVNPALVSRGDKGNSVTGYRILPGSQRRRVESFDLDAMAQGPGVVTSTIVLDHASSRLTYKALKRGRPASF